MAAARVTEDGRRLLAAIEALPIGPQDAALTFTDRLARENGWSAEHAAAVDAEYRRFLFLAATAEESVTPSDAVDQAWHLHLAYTHSYWDDLCGGVLGRPLHHGPTEGGPAERARYRDQYVATLARYASVFGHEPPPAIWPSPRDRFLGSWVRVDRRRMVVVDPRRASIPIFAGAGAGVVGGLAGVAWPGVVGLVVFATVFAALLTFRPPARRRRAGDDGCGVEAGCGGGADGGDSGCGGCGGGD